MSTPTDHHHSDAAPAHSDPQSPSSAPTTVCLRCGNHSSSSSPTTNTTTSFSPPPWNDLSSPPPVYRPIKAPAINAPPPNTQAIILTPVPQPLPVPLSSPPHHFHAPSKQINSPDDLHRFHSSSAGRHFLGFVSTLSASVRGCKISDPCPHRSPAVDHLLSILKSLSAWIDEIPPAPQTSRYGNPSFRAWHSRLTDSGESIVRDLIVIDDLKEAAVELVHYLLDSFGNPSRIDYGTGHETNFAAFLYCLARLGLIVEEDHRAIVLRVFVAYLDLMRKLQMTYCLEPAGSHGVWGLDDYHFLPFVFGSAQLIDHRYMKPKSIHNPDILDNFSGEYMYLSCVAFVKKVKKGVFAEHSPMLDDISGVATWQKVNGGLLKMYKAEVLEKVPIMQHFLFGSLIPW
ncbi:hypothetical protein QJS04_geneDACA017403 [Acorus gramineus]|uniref:Serine/threonine-protein phosphatase 2A activator n=1 Tax=Acorus gramineus TaxID=55184 RepID=A0AAV9AFA5_ACOGR|nr:hypothetical protein QJS04_geneDACA017403 [Acorus gramineus]